MPKLEDTKELVMIKKFADKLEVGLREFFYDVIAPKILELGEMYGKTYPEKENSSKELTNYFKAKSRE